MRTALLIVAMVALMLVPNSANAAPPQTAEPPVAVPAAAAHTSGPACHGGECTHFRTPLRSLAHAVVCHKPVRTACCKIVCQVRCCR